MMSNVLTVFGHFAVLHKGTWKETFSPVATRDKAGSVSMETCYTSKNCMYRYMPGLLIETELVSDSATLASERLTLFLKMQLYIYSHTN